MDSFFQYKKESSPSLACLERRKSKGWNRESSLGPEGIRDLKLAANEHRRLLFQLGAKHGIKLHYGACLSMTEVMVALYLHWLDIAPENLESDSRERFILSKGHAAPSLYVLLFQAGFVKDSDFACYRELDSIFQGHPDRNKTPGVDCTTGSLGQGLGVAVGLSWGYRQRGIARSIYCLISDGECNEGSIWESALIASNARLDNLIVFVDRNRKSSFGVMEGRNDVAPLAEKWHSFGWDVYTVDGHDIEAILLILASASSNKNGQPKVIIAITTKGKGIPFAERNFVRSSSFLEAEQLNEAIESLNKEEAMLRA